MTENDLKQFGMHALGFAMKSDPASPSYYSLHQRLLFHQQEVRSHLLTV